MKILPKNAREPKTKHLEWTPELEDYWAGYFDGRHKEAHSTTSGRTRYKLESPTLGHLDMLRIKYPRRRSRLITRYEEGSSQPTDTWYRFTLDDAPRITYNKHYLRGWYDSKFQVTYGKDHKEIYITGSRAKLNSFLYAFEQVFHYKPRLFKYHSSSDSLKFRLTGERVDLFLAAIFDPSCFLPDKWPKRFRAQYVAYNRRRYPGAAEREIDS